MTVLVTGGAGYIGSHTVHRLREQGRAVVVLDDLSSGRREAVPSGAPLVVGDVADRDVTARLIHTHDVTAIVHFAARIQVGESVVDPRRYWMGNVVATASLLESALDAGVRHFILSSTAAVYGTPARVPLTETDAATPINPYGETKLAIEKMLATYAQAYGLRYAALRYFNAAGALPDAGLGELHDPETHLVPIVLDAASGERPNITVYGRDYDTPDGTCIRDYIHVVDLADAHIAALSYLEGNGASGAFNLGTGQGHSVAEVIDVCRAVTGREIPVVYGPRREGDPPALVASPHRAEERFGWRAQRSSLERIVRDAWAWHERARTMARGDGNANPTPQARRKQEHANGR
ncbi:MAG: UDP-glucose 4-epimerase [Labilithrix sp.]|nr:UDP-glucose 4-epimerase [Labilithrix sp.]